MESRGGTIISVLSIVTATIFVIIYLGAAWELYEGFAHTSSGDPTRWDHAWSIFTGIQSAGLSAIGVLLGVAVQQPRVSEAKEQASRAKSAIKQVLEEDKRSTNEAGGGGVSARDSTALKPEVARVLREGLGR